MTIAVPPAGGGGGLPGRSSGSGLADVIDTILDKGLVIDAYVRVSLVGIEILTIDVRVVVASVDTYLRFAEAVNRLDIAAQQKGLPDLLSEAPQSIARGKSKGIAQGVLEAAGEKLQDLMTNYGEEPAPRARRRRREED
ncbi:gas vesicle protein GvpJ [Microbispora amethystogenes]|uniref:Gas vesicle protein A n=1 Tax=Microbispora amethystogenes TaxID=1427754 RepID=A0ABQ4FNM9_9ACTN|nr:gas vesicle protein GvpJ [Microbispora amethystogenes]GIH36362.1 putative gas vesicle structural protein 1 [Microbispora amethystogenes]